jgi:hypothetical protein
LGPGSWYLTLGELCKEIDILHDTHFCEFQVPSFKFRGSGFGFRHLALVTLPRIHDSGPGSWYLTLGELCEEIGILHDIHFCKFQVLSFEFQLFIASHFSESQVPNPECQTPVVHNFGVRHLGFSTQDSDKCQAIKRFDSHIFGRYLFCLESVTAMQNQRLLRCSSFAWGLTGVS